MSHDMPAQVVCHTMGFHVAGCSLQNTLHGACRVRELVLMVAGSRPASGSWWHVIPSVSFSFFRAGSAAHILRLRLEVGMAFILHYLSVSRGRLGMKT